MSPINKAREYILNSVQKPALLHSSLPEKLKNKVKSSNIWIENFDRIGDLITYLKRFNVGNADPTYKALHAHGLKTFEDISSSFESEFSLWANDCTRSTDFIVGEKYNSYKILIFAKNYDTRAGGMFVLKSGGKPTAVIIKATLHGGRYSNEWLEESLRLKYYLKSIDDVFGEHFKANASILNDKKIPILTFVRDSDKEDFTYQGVFKYRSITTESDNSKWFELERNYSEDGVVQESNFLEEVFTKKIRQARKSTREQRLARLAVAPKKPEKIVVVSTAYSRNPDVVAEVLERAQGVCQGCNGQAPFNRKSDGSPYLEVHHKILLADDGDDTVENAIALCPNCHREKHYGK